MAAGLTPAAGQFTRYAIVGVGSNLALFLLYLLLTGSGMGHKLAATVSYVLGVLLTFVLNRSWSFRSGGRPAGQLGRYAAAHVLGYGINLLGLYTFVDLGGFRHPWVQGMMIVVVAVILFLLQKFWVFRDPDGRDEAVH